MPERFLKKQGQIAGLHYQILNLAVIGMGAAAR